MDSVGAMVLGAVALFGAGLGIGYLMFAAGGRQRAQTEELKQEFDAYRNQVNEHFAQSAEYFQTIGREYRALYEHMAAGADALCDTRGAEQRLSFDPQLVAVAEAADVAEESVTADAAETVDLQPDEAEAEAAPAEAEPSPDEAEAPVYEPQASLADAETPTQDDDEARTAASTAADDEGTAPEEPDDYPPAQAADEPAADEEEVVEDLAAEADDEDQDEVNVYGDPAARSAAAAAEDLDAAEAPELPEIELPDIEESPAETKEPTPLTGTAAESAAKVLVEETTGTDEVRTYH